MNGEDLIDAGQAMYFAKVFSAMSDKFIKEGKADFSGPEFAALAEFVKNNIPEKSISWDNNESTPVSKVATFTSSYGLSGFFYNIANINGDAVILGIPSADGRGPLFEAYSSVAVSAQTKNVDACVEFVKILLSDEIQEKLANEEHLVINRQALRTSGLKAIEYYNLSSIGMGTYAAVDPSQKNSRYKYSEKDLDKLEKIILSCSGMKTQDTAISIILIEEMPPEGDLAKWVPPLDRYGKPKYRFSAETLKKASKTMSERYGVEFIYCDGRSTGRLLLELLKGVYKNESVQTDN